MVAKIVATNQQQREQTPEKIKQMLVPTEEEKKALTQQLNGDATTIVSIDESLVSVMEEVDKRLLSQAFEVAALPADLFDPFFKELAAIIYDNLPQDKRNERIQKKIEELQSSLHNIISGFLLGRYYHVDSLQKVITT